LAAFIINVSVRVNVLATNIQNLHCLWWNEVGRGKGAVQDNLLSCIHIKVQYILYIKSYVDLVSQAGRLFTYTVQLDRWL
jgi:hypothetical protein